MIKTNMESQTYEIFNVQIWYIYLKKEVLHWVRLLCKVLPFGWCYKTNYYFFTNASGDSRDSEGGLDNWTPLNFK